MNEKEFESDRKIIGVVLPSWNPNEPRFIIENCEDRIAENREFRNNTCVYNQRLGFAYSVEEIVEVLNNMGDEIDKLKEENEKFKKMADLMEYQLKVQDRIIKEYEEESEIKYWKDKTMKLLMIVRAELLPLVSDQKVKELNELIDD